jgi:uncharacterized membrane protein YphA (DoxX/SURF4 family)
VAVSAGVVFVSFGLGHFANHGSDVGDFRHYQVPFPSLGVWGAGVVELIAGVALVFGLFVRLAAALLAADMIGVVSTAGRVDGGFLNLGVAPMLFVAMVFLVWAGPGVLTLDHAMARRGGGKGPAVPRP